MKTDATTAPAPAPAPAPPPPGGTGAAAGRGFLAGLALGLMALWFTLRLALYARFASEVHAPAGGIATAFGRGLQRDLLVALAFTLPWAFVLALAPDRWRPRPWFRRTFFGAFGLFAGGQVFLAVVEFCFFEEFRSRFNTVSVDYLLYPHEVFVNLGESYPVFRVIGGCAALGFGVTWLLRRWLRTRTTDPAPPRLRRREALLLLAVTVALGFTVPLRFKNRGEERLLNEFANNGPLAFLSAAITRHLDYTAFYPTLTLGEAYQRTRALVAQPGAAFTAAGHSILRDVAGDPARPRRNVVLLLEESFGSEFWGSLGATNSYTPEMDALAAREGLLFTNIYASGNRTVRGMEGVLASFPPLPGDSIVVRDLSEHVETVARVLRRDGYQTVFAYGGRGTFDGTRFFALRNGYDRFLEQKDIPHPTFTTAWGVCDEDLYDRALEEFRTLHATGQPFFATLLTVSNHRPFTYPRGRIPEDPDKQWRHHAVKYSDYALGRFFRQARQEPFWTNTLFVVVADHGARVYGSEAIPIKSYEIPLLLVGPAFVPAPSRNGTLGGSLDVAPTILGLLGRPYRTTFFGRDLLKPVAGGRQVPLHHNRDIGLYDGSGLVILGMRQGVEHYTGDAKQGSFRPQTAVTDEDRERYQNAVALFQVADDLYQHERYRVESTNEPSAAAAAPAR